MSGGGDLRSCLSGIEKLEDATGPERQLAADRVDYVSRLMKPPIVRYSVHQRHEIEHSRETYIGSILGKIQRVIEAETPQEALRVRQMPTIVEASTFRDDPPSMEDLAANQLYIVMDTALCEHISRRGLIDQIRADKPVKKVLGNRVLRIALAGSAFIATIFPALHFIPIENAATASDVELSVLGVSGVIFGYEFPEEARLWDLDIRNSKRTKKLRDELASDQRISDLALRMAYSSTRYGDETGNEFDLGHHGTSDKDENLRRFDKLDEEFTYLNNDPGGKPYNGNQALGYAARFLIERKQQLTAIIAGGKTATEREDLFMQLSSEILTEDLIRMEDGLGASLVRQSLLRGMGIAVAAAFPQFVSVADNATSLSSDVRDVGLDSRITDEDDANE
jgi:hypothetical protein